MTDIRDLCPLDMSPEGEPGTLVVEYEHLLLAIREYAAEESDAVSSVVANLQQNRPSLPVEVAWEAARYSVMSSVLWRIAEFPSPLSPRMAHLIPRPGGTVYRLLSLMLDTAAEYQVRLARQAARIEGATDD